MLKGVLPPKKEIVVYAAMTPLQKTYEALILQHQLKDTLQSSGIPCTGKEVSENNMLMNQRKNANHPFLFGRCPCGNQPVSQLIFASTASESVVEPSTPSTRRVPRFSPSESGRVSRSRHRGHVFSSNSDTTSL